MATDSEKFCAIGESGELVLKFPSKGHAEVFKTYFCIHWEAFYQEACEEDDEDLEVHSFNFHTGDNTIPWK